ncbi:hypothetical protein F5146DRAFT_1122416 [Armillaria mellea]|nr:hypothetical protein F5146DRAFT_1122416 [Armillaria mellea]
MHNTLIYVEVTALVILLSPRPDLNSITASDCQDIGNTAVVNSFLPMGIGISRSDELMTFPVRAKVNDHTRELGCGEGDGRMFESACARVDGIRRRLDGWRGRAIIRLEEGVGLLELADEAEGHGWTQDLGEQTTSSADVESIRADSLAQGFDSRSRQRRNDSARTTANVSRPAEYEDLEIRVDSPRNAHVALLKIAKIQESLSELSTSISAGLTNFATNNLKGTNLPTPAPVVAPQAQHKTLPHALGRAAMSAAQGLGSEDRLGRALELYAGGYDKVATARLEQDESIPPVVMRTRQAITVSRLELDAAKQTLKNANLSEQERARLEVENAEHGLVWKTEPEPLKNLNELAKSQLMFYAATAEALSSVQGEIEELSVAAEGEYSNRLLLVEWNENDDDSKYRRQAGEGWYNKCETINHFEAEIIIDALSLSADSILDLEEQGSRPCRKHLFAKHEFPTSLSRDSDIPCPATGDRFIRDKSKEVNPIILVTFRGCCHTYVRQICLRIEMCRHRTIAKSSSGCDGHRGRM